MAYSVKGLAIINDSRELLGVNTAGINTALYVGDVKIQDGIIEAQTGVVTFVGDGRSLTGIVTVSDSGGTPEFSGNLSVDGQLSVSGLASLGGGVDVTGHIEGDTLNISGITTLSSLEFADGVSLDGVTEDLDVSATGTQLVTAEAAKAYADSIVGAGNTMEFTGNTGETGAVDLVTETFTITGDDNEIVTDVPTADGNGITIGLSDELIAPGSLQVTGLATFVSNVEYATGASFSFADDGNAVDAIGISSTLAEDVAAETRLVSEKAIKQFVDGVSANVEANANLRIEDAAGGIGTVALGTENLVFNGVANETLVEVSGAPGELTVGLATDVTIAGDLTVTNNFQFDGGQAVDTIGINTDLGGGTPVDTTIPTQKAVKEYVDSQIGAANQLRFEGDTGGQLEIELDSEVLELYGTTNEIETVGAGNSMTFGLPDSVEITSTLAAANVNGNTMHVGTSAIGGESGSNLLEFSVGGPGGTNAMFINGSSLDAFRFVDNLTDVFVLDHSGTTNVATLTGHLDVSAGAQITGICTATDFNSTSDINKKENIVEIADAVEKVEALRGVTFDWKDGSGKSGGTIAQEVQAVLPEIVKEGEHLTVNYNGLTGLLIQAVKELSARVAELEGKA